jgi:outer membrane murein-binding lipoprotein Lpp
VREQRTEQREHRAKSGAQRTEYRRLSFDSCLLVSVFCLLAFLAGCESGSTSRMAMASEIEKLSRETADLNRQIEQLKSDNAQLRKQIKVLSGLSKDELEDLYKLQRIKIGGYTNFYDKDKDGKKEKLIVYIQPIDQDGDIIKIAGAVEVQLWDLSREVGEALIAEWDVPPNQLRKLWYAALKTNYRLSFDVADKIGSVAEPLTVKVSFTDYLTGKVFTEQKVIRP